MYYSKMFSLSSTNVISGIVIVLYLLIYTCAPSGNSTTSASQNSTDTDESQMENKIESLLKEKKERERPLSSNQSLFKHLQWGEESQRLWKNDSDATKRHYVGYGQCISRWPIFYPQHIQQATSLDLIILAYIEMFRMHCKDNIQEKFKDLFDKGYARLQMDHSISYSNHTILFIKPRLSFWDIDDLESLLEFSAFTQVYVSWYRFPVSPIDPLGYELKDACFIEIVARLHALDLIMAVARRHTSMIAYLMGIKLKMVIKIMREDFKGIKGHDKETNHRRTVSRRCMVVTMALAQFLARDSEASMKYGCAHAAFKDFYMKKEDMFEKIVESRYGRRTEIEHMHEASMTGAT